MKQLPARLLLAAALVFIFSMPVFTQSMETEVIGSAGISETTSSGAGLQWTVGEPMIRTVVNAAVLSEGFHQTVIWEIVPVYEAPELEFSVWPNPFSQYLEIKTARPVSAVLLDIPGRKVSDLIRIDQHGVMQLGQLPAGAYFLEVSDLQGKRLATYKLVRGE
jgi:hypothetical protein